MTPEFDQLKGAMDAIEGLAPIFDAADGMRADMERRGWSPTIAEQIAYQWLANILALIFTNHNKEN